MFSNQTLTLTLKGAPMSFANIVDEYVERRCPASSDFTHRVNAYDSDSEEKDEILTFVREAVTWIYNRNHSTFKDLDKCDELSPVISELRERLAKYIPDEMAEFEASLDILLTGSTMSFELEFKPDFEKMRKKVEKLDPLLLETYVEFRKEFFLKQTAFCRIKAKLKANRLIKQLLSERLKEIEQK